MLAARIIVVVCGALLFLACAVGALYRIRSSNGRAERLEAAGILVPGSAGLLIAMAGLLVPSAWGVACSVGALPVLIIGRALYELVVFRNRGGDPAQ